MSLTTEEGMSMKLMKQLFGALLVTTAALALFVACSTTGDDCALDSDCSADQVCEDSVCVATCTTAADCAAGEACEPRTSGTGNVCKSGGSNNVNNTNNINNVNNTNNANNTVSYSFFLIEDTTVDDCDIADPGSDMQYVAITDLGGANLGYGVLRDQMFGTGDNNEYIDTGILDGNPPDFAGQCADDFNDTTVVSMGCQGQFLLQAVDGTGTPFAIEAGTHQLEIGEYGSTCQGSATDGYNVFGCTAGDGGLATTTCDVLLGSGEGITIVDVE